MPQSKCTTDKVQAIADHLKLGFTWDDIASQLNISYNELVQFVLGTGNVNNKVYGALRVWARISAPNDSHRRIIASANYKADLLVANLRQKLLDLLLTKSTTEIADQWKLPTKTLYYILRNHTKHLYPMCVEFRVVLAKWREQNPNTLVGTWFEGIPPMFLKSSRVVGVTNPPRAAKRTLEPKESESDSDDHGDNHNDIDDIDDSMCSEAIKQYASP
jgi:hypothetical protein